MLQTTASASGDCLAQLIHLRGKARTPQTIGFDFAFSRITAAADVGASVVVVVAADAPVR